MRRSKQRQLVFDLVVAHLAQQGRRSITSGTPMYRTRDGLRCAVGCLINDDHYERAFEGVAIDAETPVGARVRAAVNHSLGIKLRWVNNDLNFLRDLQYAHDNMGSPEALRFELRKAAKFWNVDSSRVASIEKWET